MKTIELNYEGYWREKNFSGVPKYSGVYSFQECKYNPNNDSVTLIRLLYIGQAENCHERISNHDKIAAMKRSLSPGNELCVHTAPCADPDKSRAENALIYHHKPPFNDDLKDRFNYDTTTMVNNGRYSLLTQRFTVYQNVGSLYRY